jgi:MFS family permease
MTLTSHAEESSLRYPGWRVVAVCFVVEMFIFGFGLYGHGIYLAELQRLHECPTALVSAASTLSFLLANLLAPFTSDALFWIGPRLLILVGILALATSTTLLAFAATALQLYAAYVLMSFGWAGMGTVVIATILKSWFDRRAGLAISLAFNGATCGGIVVAPALVLLVGAVGFTSAMLTMTVVMVAVLAPVVVATINLPAASTEQARAPTNAPPSGWSRWTLLQGLGFWTVTAPFGVALLAQVGFIVHQIAFLEPTMGRSLAGFAVAVTTTMAVIGRLCLGLVVDSLDPRLATTASLATQAGALFAMVLMPDIASLFVACAVYGFSIGNLITLPPLIIQREFAQATFGTVLGLSTAISGIMSALGPSLVGFVRGATGGYATALMFCMVLKLFAATIVLLRPRRAVS